MNIDYTVTALMFPAIPLIMSVYSNRFHTLSSLIRKIHDEFVFEKHTRRVVFLLKHLEYENGCCKLPLLMVWLETLVQLLCNLYSYESV